MDFLSLFNQGISYEEFLDQKDEDTKQKLINFYNNINLNDDLEQNIKTINKDINILAFAEIWCPDCMINVPALQKIHNSNQNISFKIIKREGNEKFLNDFMENGKVKIPTFIVLENDKVLGAFIERPKFVKNIENSTNQVDIIVTKKKYRNGEYINETIKDILDIINL